MKMTGAEIFIQCLKDQGVDTVFGFPGGAVLNIYDALYRMGSGIRHILTSHEQGASHAADGYARATGKTGVCIATSGPGATNLVTGIATAYMDSVPMVAFTGQVSTSLLGKDSFQEVDITGITLPITKHNYIVKDVRELADIIREAFAIAQEGRPGPVLVDICKDVTAASAEYTAAGKTSAFRHYTIGSKAVMAAEEELDTAAQVICDACRPVIIAGGGVTLSGAAEVLRLFAEKRSIPVSNTLMGLGSIPGTHPLFTGMVGMHGTRASNLAVSHSDLIIAIGARFSDRVISDVNRFAPHAKIMHIDIDPAEINKNIMTDYPLAGDLSHILKALIDRIPEHQGEEWLEQINSWKESALTYRKDEVLRPQYIIEQLYRLTGGEAIITTEVGQNQIWAAQYYKYSSPRQFISSGGLGTMGYGLGACIGAQLGKPDKKVVNIAGDGSFRMNCNELATAVEYKLPVVIAILNNHALGMVRQWQNLFYDERYSSTTIGKGTNFAALAEAYGAKGLRVTRPEEVEGALAEALASVDRPVVIDFEVPMDEKVFPIVPPGAPIHQLIEE